MTANREWMSRPADQRFETLDALAARVGARRNLSTAVDIDVRKLHVESQDVEQQYGDKTVTESRLVLDGATQPAAPTHWSFGQLCRTTQLGSDTMRRLPTDIVADALNYRLGKVESPDLKLMAIKDPEGEMNTLQAITSRTYGRIWDADVVASTQTLVARAADAGKHFFNPKDWSGKPSGLYASDHDIFMFMVDGGSVVDVGFDQKGQPDLMHRGFIISNSEVGAASFNIMMFMFRVVCGNHIIWDATDVNKLMIRHTSGGPARFDSQALPALRQYCEAAAGPQEAMIKKAQSYLLPDKPDDLLKFLRGKGFSKVEVADAVEAARKEEGDARTLWQIVNGFTASARQYAHLDTRLNLEKRAGALLDLVGKPGDLVVSN